MRLSLTSLLALLAIVVCFVVSTATVGAADASILKKMRGETVLLPEELGLISLSVNDQLVSEIEVFTSGGIFYLPVKFLDSMLLDYLAPSVHDLVFGTVLRGLVWAGPEELRLAGFAATGDSATLSMNVGIPPRMRPVTEIQLTKTFVNNIKPILRPSPFSVILNTNTRAGVDFSVSDFSIPLNIQAELAVNLLDWVIEANAGAALSSMVPSASLQTLKLVHDFGSIKARLAAGTVQSTTMGYQQSASMYGISLDSFNFVPTKRSIEVPVSDFIIEERALLRIILNGTTLSSMYLDPGVYKVSDLNFSFGINDFIIEIDEQGRELRRIRVVISRDDVMLTRGASEFSVAAGVGKTDFTEGFGSIFYRLGITDNLSSGAYLQADKRSALLGIQGILTGSFGSFSGNAGLLAAWDGRPYAFVPAVSLKYRLIFPGRSNMPTLGAEIEYKGRGFVPPQIGATLADAESFVSLSGQISKQMPFDFFLGLSGSWSHQLTGSTEDRVNFNFSVSKNIRPGHSLAISGGFNDVIGSVPNISATVSLTVTPQKDSRMVGFTQSLTGGNSFSYTSLANSAEDIDTSLQGQNVLGLEDQPANLEFSARKSTARADFSAYLGMGYGGLIYPVPTRAYASVVATTCIVYTEGKFGISRRVPDAFMLFSPAKSLASERIDVRLESGLSDSSRNGSSVVIPLLSYRPIIAGLNLLESSPDIQPRVGYALLSPSYRSGIFYTTDVMRKYVVTGSLTDSSGTPLGYQMAEVFSPGGDSVGTTFTDENGNFELYDLGEGSFTIRWPLNVGVTHFEIPENAPGNIVLGTMVPEPQAEGTQ